MEPEWHGHFTELVSFVTTNTCIRIDSETIDIPSDVRKQFYELFDLVRKSFVEEHFASQLVKGQTLCNAWAEVNASIEQSGFGPIEIHPELNWFMLNPIDGLKRQLYNALFSLLRSEIDLQTFGKQGHKLVSDAFDKFYRLGYMYWIQLALFTALQADKNYRVPVIDSVADVLMGEGHENPGDHLGNVPALEECTTVTFIQQPIVSFMAPRIILHSTKLQQLLGLCTDFVEPQWRTNELNNTLEWYNLPALLKAHNLEKPRPDYKMPIEFTRIMSDILVYTTHSSDDIRLVADYYHFLRPDLCLDVMEQPDWYEKGGLEIIKKRHSVMRPRRGTYILCLEQPQQAVIDELAPKQLVVPNARDQQENTMIVDHVQDLRLLHCGLDVQQLGMLVDILGVE